MNQLEELKAFVSERLHAAASEILGAIEKTVTDYEEQACRLKEENDRHRSVLDLIIKTKLPQTGGWSIRNLPSDSACNRATEAPSLEVVSNLIEDLFIS